MKKIIGVSLLLVVLGSATIRSIYAFEVNNKNVEEGIVDKITMQEMMGENSHMSDKDYKDMSSHMKGKHHAHTNEEKCEEEQHEKEKSHSGK